MPAFISIRRSRPVPCIGAVALAAVLSLTTFGAYAADDALRLTRHVILDKEGYGEPIEAMSLLVPHDWQTESRVAWVKPCSAGTLHDILLRSVSPDGRYGFQVLPGLGLSTFSYQFTQAPSYTALGLNPEDYYRPVLEQAINQWRASVRGSNCHEAGDLDATQIVQSFVIPQRPPGAEIVETEELSGPKAMLDAQVKLIEDNLAPLQNQMAMMPGAAEFIAPPPEYRTDAKRIRLRYNTSLGMIEEDLIIAIMETTSYSRAIGLELTNKVTFMLPIMSAWFPAGSEEAAEPIFTAIGQSMRTNPRWEAANAKTMAAINRIRAEGARKRHEMWMEAQQEISDMRYEAWKERQRSDDHLAAEFIESIRETERVTDPTTGHPVEMPAHYDRYYTNGLGDYLAIPQGTEPNDYFPDQDWQQMPVITR